MGGKINKKYIKILAIILSMILIAFTLKEANISKVIEEISKINIFYFFISIIIMVLVFFTRAIRWFLLIRHDVKFKNVYESMMIGYFIHNIVPFRIGELIRIYFLNSKSNISTSYLLGTVLAEKILDGLSLIFIFIVLTTSINIENSFLKDTAKILMLILIIFFIIFYLLKVIKLNIKSDKKLSNLNLKIRKIANKIIDGSHTFGNLKKFLYTLSLSIIIWLIENLAIVYILKAFSINIEDIFIKSIVPLLIINMGIMIPSGPGDLGMFEIAGKQGFGNFLNININTAISITLIFHLITVLPGLIIGGFYMLKYHLSLKIIEEEKSA
ncbi:MAG TPA: lysylphosphatidylglycerol synthase transmembrane domain-containing protein [Spirochaetota bacterium]|nr:lysylphosphatidylglycerol synthase transmembrane domain-containing protein [Spirochaetota bacterium]HOM37732.1 lysylphosphatidylglycerol synthase transmembrane domain-containing protein [Spirochaetota bacterium]HPQ49690.1 lysylphosphatidylglycerol synthase transmembrane domain-containing protein [Spirochaetota bacterium]